MTAPLDRRTSILILLDSLLDYLPTLRSSTGQLAASGGTAVGTVVDCGRCSGSGVEIVERWNDGHRRQVACGSCSGSGKREAKRGEQGTDPMIDRSAKGALAIRGRGMERQEMDSAIARLDRDARDRSGERSTRDAYGWERERQALRKGGCYAELEDALEWLREHAPGRSYRAWRYAQHLRECWSEDVWRDFHETVDAIGLRMPERLRVPDSLRDRGMALVAEALWSLDDRPEPPSLAVQVRALREQNPTAPASLIAWRFGISKRTVERMIATSM